MNARRWVLATLGALALIAAAYSFLTGEPSPTPAEHALSAADAAVGAVPARLRGGEIAARAEEGETQIAPGSGALGAEDSDPHALSALAPDSQQVLAEARENPHQTPQSLIDFAHQLAGPMERAQKSEKEALPVFAQMESCASDRVGAQPIQARVVCLANAARLAELYPTPLAARYQALARANPALASILETTGL